MVIWPQGQWETLAMVVGTVVSAVGGMVAGDGCAHGTHLIPPNGTFKPQCVSC